MKFRSALPLPFSPFITWNVKGLSLGVALAMLDAATAGASVIYNYTGNTYDFVSGAFTTSDKFTGSMTLNSALPANITLSVTPTSFSFNDGLSTITTSVIAPTFVFRTDAAGAITGWNVKV